MQMVWATDIHLNAVEKLQRRRFYRSVAEQGDICLITGDLATSVDLADKSLRKNNFYTFVRRGEMV